MRKEPRGDRRDDLRAANLGYRICAAISSEPGSPEDYLLRFNEVQRHVTNDPEVNQMIDDFFQPLPLIGFDP